MSRKSPPTSDLYAVLGVGSDAGVEEIRKAYKNLALRYHPDKAGNTQDANERFGKILEAYEILSDKGQRRDSSKGTNSTKSSSEPLTRDQVLKLFYYHRAQRALRVIDRQALPHLSPTAIMVLLLHLSNQAREHVPRVDMLLSTLGTNARNLNGVLPLSNREVWKQIESAREKTEGLRASLFQLINGLDNLRNENPVRWDDFFGVSDKVDSIAGRLNTAWPLAQKISNVGNRISRAPTKERALLAIQLVQALKQWL
ncbi:hypothetical protein F5X99DRAFT_431044 [Biscogniauxia marginata]|nr:hypothetical protein F5X99DRAFT_431044 [Biscogniauxia marginata]